MFYLRCDNRREWHLHGSDPHGIQSMVGTRWSPLPHSTVHTASDIKGHSAVRFAAAAWHLWDSLMWQPRQLLLPAACCLLPLSTLLARMPAQFWLPSSLSLSLLVSFPECGANCGQLIYTRVSYAFGLCTNFYTMCMTDGDKEALLSVPMMQWHNKVDNGSSNSNSNDNNDSGDDNNVQCQQRLHSSLEYANSMRR